MFFLQAHQRLDLGGLAKKNILTHNTGKFAVTLFNKLEEIPP